ncbi:MAG TPA: adenylate/guanylate cyclase domain-containing protein [Steroidobacteraceae bacterium]|nr:adenylate/guanylate cyclase domain-containing protein [Steroidobacteraceae bacterium]
MSAGPAAGRTPKLRATGTMTVKRATRAAAPQTARLTVLFADLRGYTALAERLAPARIVPLLEEFFHVLARTAIAHGGTVFHMAGDGMMAGFGGQDLAAYGARNALVAGHSMLQQFGTIAARWRRDLSIDTGIGVGLHLGEVAMGILGPPGHKSTTLVGDTVNVAARLCSRARAGEVLLSCTVAAALELDAGGGELYIGPIPVLHLPQYALRGRSAPLDIWCVPAVERLAY